MIYLFHYWFTLFDLSSPFQLLTLILPPLRGITLSSLLLSHSPPPWYPEAGLLWDRARREALRGAFWSTYSGQLPRPHLQSAGLREWEGRRRPYQCMSSPLFHSCSVVCYLCYCYIKQVKKRWIMAAVLNRMALSTVAPSTCSLKHQELKRVETRYYLFVLRLWGSIMARYRLRLMFNRVHHYSF